MLGQTMTDAPSLSTLFKDSLKIGCLGFGGPAGQIALMHRVFVEERKWIDEARFQHMLAFCMLLPGPEAQQLATYVGWRLRGATGAVIAGWLFVLPGAVVVLGLSWLYVLYGTMPLVAAVFDGVKCAVVALVAEALFKIGKRALKTRVALWVGVAAFAALVFGAPFPIVIVAAALCGVLFARAFVASGLTDTHSPDPPGEANAGAALINAALWLALWLLPVAALAVMLGGDHVLVQIAALFSILACVTFGGAYALLAYLTDESTARGWLTPAQMIDGLGLAETTPGPLILVNEFVGFLAGWSEGALGLALAGAAIALWCTFAPSFVWIFAGAPFAERLQRDRRAAGALAAITAAVLGVIAKLALFFATHALFERQIAFGPVELPDLTSARLWMVALSAAAAVALIRYKTNLLLVLAVCALAGLAFEAGGL
jgi:chromate transporter